jgi:hypothetical protein
MSLCAGQPPQSTEARGDRPAGDRVTRRRGVPEVEEQLRIGVLGGCQEGGQQIDELPALDVR